MTLPELTTIDVILASKSPRRKTLLTDMGIKFTVKTKDVDESFPQHLKAEQAALFIAEKKAVSFLHEQKPNELFIAADNIVCLGDEIIGKPKDMQDAIKLLTRLSGKNHEV